MKHDHDYHPRGVDNQGRHPEHAEAPAPAEAATHIGHDEPPHVDPWRRREADVWIVRTMLAVLLIGSVTLLALLWKSFL